MLAALLLGAVALILLGGLTYQHLVTNKLHRCDWNDLLTQLQAVPRAPVSEVATDYLNPQANQIVLQPMDVWAAVGGIEGVRRMRHNADVLIALAAYAERWNFEEGVIVAERMRRDALQLRRATLQVRLRMSLHAGRIHLPFYVHEAAVAYHLMTERLLALYKSSHAGLYPQLAEALN
jgi:hypothetical protein